MRAGKVLRSQGWFWCAVILTVFKLALTQAQSIYAIGPAIHDERLFLELARHIVHGDWLGPYNQLTLAKGPIYSLFIAGNFLLGLPLGLTQQLLYVAACAVAVLVLRPGLRAGWARCALYTLLLWNPFTYEGESMTRILRQHLTTPFALIIAASLIALILRRHDSWRRRLPWALTAGFVLGLFWLTREQGKWIVPMVVLLGLAALSPCWRGGWRVRRGHAGLLLAAGFACILPWLVIGAINRHYYGWFGTVEFHARDFQDAYGALTRVKVGPEYPHVAVTSEARQALYRVSPAMRELQPYFENPADDHWINREDFPAAQRQIESGWFMWAFRDAVASAGYCHSAKQALAFYHRLAAEVNAACDRGLVPALGPRTGFFPPWQAAYTRGLFTEGPRYLRMALDPPDFKTFPTPSFGDNVEVELFRDITNERISPAPRALYITLPERQRMDALKLTLLRHIGRVFFPVCFGLILAATALLGFRLLQSAWQRRPRLSLWLALGVFCGGASEIALNLLVHVTSFPNMYPAAYAPAYPLMLLFVGLMTVDFHRETWPGLRRWLWPRALEHDRLRRWVRWGLPGGAALLVLAGRFREILHYTGPIPFLDQWKTEAAQIISPWLHGALHPSDFFLPQAAHVPLWSNLLVWLETVVTHAWDPLVQTAVNAFALTVFVFLLARWLTRSLGRVALTLIVPLVVSLYGLPHAWENITWGHASAVPLALLLLFWQAHASCCHPAGSRRWWWGQVAASAGLFTLGDMWTAPLALALIALWTGGWRPVKRWLVPALIAAFGLALVIILRQPAPVAADGELAVLSLPRFLHAFILQSGWPLPLLGAAVILQLPWFAFALQSRHRPLSGPDQMVLALGLWAVLQAAAIACTPAGSGPDFASRHSGLLAVGVLANALALTRWLSLRPRRWLWLTLPLAALWLAVALAGLHRINTSGPILEFQANAAPRAAYRVQTITACLQHHDAALLSTPLARQLISPDSAAVARLLDDPAFAALLPLSPARTSSIGQLVRWLQSLWWLWSAIGLLLLVLGLSALWRQPGVDTLTAPVLALQPDPWRWRIIGLLTVLSAAAAMFLWPLPLTFNPTSRWQTLLTPPSALTGLHFSFAAPASWPDSRLTGAAQLSPAPLRNHFWGTHIDGPGFTGEIRSDAFPLRQPFLIVPCAGFPASPGNALQLQILDASGHPSATLACPGPNPAAIGFWNVNVAAYVGRSARLVLVDGRTDAQGWLAVGPPQPGERKNRAAALATAWRREPSAPVRPALDVIALLGLASLFWTFALRRWLA